MSNTYSPYQQGPQQGGSHYPPQGQQGQRFPNYQPPARGPSPPQQMARPPTPHHYMQHPGMIGMQGNQQVFTYQVPSGSMGGPVPNIQYHLLPPQQQPQPYPNSGQRGPAPTGAQVMTPGAPPFNPGGPYGGSGMPVQYPPHSHQGQMGSAGQPTPPASIIYSGGPPSLNMNMQPGHPGMMYPGPRYALPPQHMMSQHSI